MGAISVSIWALIRLMDGLRLHFYAVLISMADHLGSSNRISERSGVVNIGIEGMMTIGALAGAATSFFTGNAWLGFLIAGLAGGAFALLHAVAAVTFKADQNVSGIALNLLGPGIALFLARLMWDGGTQSPAVQTLPKVFGSGAFAGTPWANLNIDVTVVLGLVAAIVVWFVLYKTKWGLRVRAVGEHPAAADTLGINVSRIRFACVVLSGVMAGFGGASITLAIISQFTQTAVAGQLHRPRSRHLRQVDPAWRIRCVPAVRPGTGARHHPRRRCGTDPQRDPRLHALHPHPGCTRAVRWTLRGPEGRWRSVREGFARVIRAAQNPCHAQPKAPVGASSFVLGALFQKLC